MTSRAPDISVIIPTFRRPRELSEAITSALSQRDARVELFVVDDSPEGVAREVVEHIKDPRILYMKVDRPTNGVPSIVRNLALKRARAPLVHFLDDDDIVPEGHYYRAMASFRKNSDKGLVFGTIEPFGSGPSSQLAAERKYFAESIRLASLCMRLGHRLAFVAALLFRHALLVCSAGIVRRECAISVGGFDPRIRIREDVDFYAFVIRRFGVILLHDVSLHYRISSTASLMHEANPTPNQKAAIEQMLREARRITNLKYRAAYGTAEFYALKAFARTVLRVL